MRMVLLFLLPLTIALLGLRTKLGCLLSRIEAALSLLQVAIALFVCLPVLRSGVVLGSDGFRIDPLGAMFILITTAMAAAASFHAAVYFREEVEAGSLPPGRICLFHSLSGLFLMSMYAVLMAHNLGYLWIAVEATTLVSAPMIYLHRSRESLEATWKYFLLCSVGIAFALFGTILILTAQHALDVEASLDLTALAERARHMDLRFFRLGFVFCLLGYGTKAGIFPLHNWLPDAHSEAPAPVSAMLSGTLLNCALVAICRVSGVLGASGSTFARDILVPLGATAVLAAGLLLIRQRGIKRMFACSSVEHVGLLTLAIGLGSGPLFALHALNHSVVKVALFLLAGNIICLYNSRSIRNIRGMLVAAPATGVLLAVGTMAIAGSPPFGVFISEWLLLAHTFAEGHPFAAAATLIGLTLTFVALAMHLGNMLFGEAPTLTRSALPRVWIVAPACLLVLSFGLGVLVSPKLLTLFSTIALGGIR